MVLEPLSAFAIACNIIQVVQVGCKLIVNATEQIKDGSELTNEHQELRDVSRTINNLCSGLEASLPTDPQALELSTNEHRLMGANKECLRISKDFMELLDRLKVKERRAVLESFKMSIRAYWFRDKIDAIQKALSQARDNLNFAFLLYMNSQQRVSAEATQDRIQSSNNKLERRIVSMIESSSDQMHAEILTLAEDLKEMYLDSDDRRISAFLASNQETMANLSRKIESLCTSQQQRHDEAFILQQSLTQRRILDSLQFPDMFQRVDQIGYAHRMTFQWMTRPLEGGQHQWSCFYSWLKAPEGSQRIYWIQGKPGSGKSTLLKFLDENLDTNTHMSSWCGGLPVYKARFFFWQPGNLLQKSIGGFYRAILFDILSQRPDLMSIVVGAERWKTASLSGTSPLTWKNSDLQSMLQQAIVSLCSNAKLFLLVDGIDEFHGNSDEQEHLLDFLLDLNSVENLKLCISSRPWNIFRDVFGRVPQLRLEELTRSDIVITVTSLLEKSSRWETFCASHPDETKSLVAEIVSKAHGVFLWVRLVMRDLLHGIRDGDSLAQLQQKLTRIPADLDDYFKRMIDSIEPKYRREASMMLQIACFEEPRFISTYRKQLVQLSFVEEQVLDFATDSSIDVSIRDLSKLRFRIDSALRKLHSRCMGLLECSYHSRESNDTVRSKTITVVDEVNLTNIGEVFGLKIDFLHRSVREFLALPQMQEFLHSYTNGPLDIRRFLCNAWLVQSRILLSSSSLPSKTAMKTAIRYGAHMLPTLSVCNSFPWSSMIFSMMQIHLISLAETQWAEYDECYAWYILPSLQSWRDECSSPLTMAIDFGLTSYVRANLATETIKSKKGRPILDYILRPRFIGTIDMRCGNHWPNIEMLQIALARGADPNQKHGSQSVSVWESFLSLWAECYQNDWYCGTVEDISNSRLAFNQALIMLLRAGARPIVGWTAMAVKYPYERYDEQYYGAVDNDLMDLETRFNQYWPSAAPLNTNDQRSKESQLYLVSTLLMNYPLFHDPAYSTLFEELRSLEYNYLHGHASSMQSVPADNNI